jgi:hypothetical protein
MKKVFTNSSDVIHLFAQRTQSEGRSSNIFFENTDKIYSYGHHYLLGEFIKNEAGELAIMINDKGYSVSTSSHISSLRSATRQYKQFLTMSTDSQYVLNQLETLATKLQNARKPEMYISSAESLYKSWNDYNLWRNSEGNQINAIAGIKTIINVFRGSKYSEYLAEKDKAIKLAEKQRELNAKKEFKVKLKKFFNFELSTVYGTEDFCRISQDQKFVETSQGVKIPIAPAKMLYKMILEKRDIKGYILKGQYSDYTVIGLNGVLKIGCHKINTKNMHEVGKKLLSM